MHSSSIYNNEIFMFNKIKVVIEKLSSVLQNLVIANQQEVNNNNGNNLKSSFDLNTVPNVSINDYILRIATYSKIGESTLICSLVLLDKFIAKTKIGLNLNNIHLLLLTSIQLAMKVNEDVILKDSDFAILGMVNTKLLARNENLFLSCIRYEAYVSENDYKNYSNFII